MLRCYMDLAKLGGKREGGVEGIIHGQHFDLSRVPAITVSSKGFKQAVFPATAFSGLVAQWSTTASHSRMMVDHGRGTVTHVD